MATPTISLLSVAVTLGLLGLYFCCARSILGMLKIEARTDEEIALAVPLLMLVAGFAFFTAEATEFVSSRVIDRALRPSLTIVQGALLVAPLVPILVWKRRGGSPLPDRIGIAWSWVPVIAVAVMVAGVWNELSTDLYTFTDTTKELVWSNATDLGADVSPQTAPEAEKYAGYHLARASIVGLAGNLPYLPDFSWSVLSAVAVLFGSYVLARNLGLGLMSGVAPLALLLLGGDAYRFATISGPRSVAAGCMLAGLAISCHAVSNASRRQALFAAALIAASATTHIQYVMIAISILIPALLVAFMVLRWTRPTQIFLIISLACGALSVLALPQAIGSIRPETVRDRAAERAALDGEEEGPEAEAPGDWVWPPQVQATGSDGTEILFVSQWVQILSPRSVVAAVWGERSSVWLSALGALAAWFLRKRIHPLGLVLLGGAFLAPLLILMNPLVFPAWSTLFGPTRSQYIGFEFGYLALAACFAAAFWYPRRLAMLALLGPVAAFFIVRSTVGWYEGAREIEAELDEPFLVAMLEVDRLTRYADTILVPRRLDEPMLVLYQRFVTVPDYLALDEDPRDVPDVFAPQPDLAAVLDELQRYPGRIVIVLDDKVPPDAAARQLIQDGLIEPSTSPAGEEGVNYIELTVNVPPERLQPSAGVGPSSSRT